METIKKYKKSVMFLTLFFLYCTSYIHVPVRIEKTLIYNKESSYLYGPCDYKPKHCFRVLDFHNLDNLKDGNVYIRFEFYLWRYLYESKVHYD